MATPRKNGSENLTLADDVRDEISMRGTEAVEFVRRLVERGNVRSVVIRKQNGDEIISLPLSIALAGAGFGLIFGRWSSIAIAALAYIADVKVEVVRTADDNYLVDKAVPKSKNKVDID